MFIKQVKHIASVGRFRNCAAEGDATFKKFTLLFGENGRGKTTLCSILRSLQTDDADIIAGRKTLGDEREPNVVLTLGTGTALFRNGTWNRAQEHLRIFDAQYVAENIYLGDAIGTDQRRNLCNVILGKEGVAIAKEYHDLDTAITEKNNAIRDARRVLTTHVQANQVDTLIGLNEDAEIDDKIEAKRKEVEGLKDIDKLRSQKLLEELKFPPMPTRLAEILGRTLKDVSRAAEAAVQAHLKAHGMLGNEEWIAGGLPHLTKECPFCGQPADGLALIKAYQSYFNDAYTSFRTELQQYQQLPAKYYSDDRITLVQTRIQSNEASTEVWKRYVVFDAPATPADLDPAELLTNFRTEMLALLERKAAALLEVVKISEEYENAYTALAELAAAGTAYDQAVTNANAKIEAFKKDANPTKLQSSQNELRWLELTKKRHEAAVAEACSQYTTLNAEKDALDKKKGEARTRLETYSATVCENYRKGINKFLKRFNAGFQLDRVRVEYSGRVANSTFCVLINEVQVEMGNSDTPLSEPSFKNTLSAGDRSTLALAFFLAEVEADPAKGDTVVVLDDPFNSQDHFRRTCTVTEIRRCGDSVAQVIVMSHDRHFLRDLWDLPLPTGDRKALWLIPFGHKDTVISEWPIETDTETEDAANRRVLLSYYLYNEGKPRDVVQKLRPVVETHMRRMAPQLLANVKGLGNMLDKVRDAQSPPVLVEAYADIEDVNTYTRKYMHGEGKNPDTEPLHTTELSGFVGKVLELTGALTEIPANAA
ncbi:AAA family ATPase [Reyranella sp.]|uniref:AAA family ATPase n=1 Tax=Reyranella sp. TaxID=1929291 RepID=UPI003D12ED32